MSRPHLGIPVRVTDDARQVFYCYDEFGEFLVVVGGSFDNAYAEMLDYLYDTDGLCEHGVEQDYALAEPVSCDCSMTDHGPVWAAHATISETCLPAHKFFLAHGYDVEYVEQGDPS